jgi:hypothetical protein
MRLIATNLPAGQRIWDIVKQHRPDNHSSLLIGQLGADGLTAAAVAESAS